jgi:hypothetical protein
MLKELTRPFRDYAPEQSVPLRGYGAALLVYGLTLSLALRVAGRRRVRTKFSDVVLLGVATHKLSRILTKDFVTAPLRAPFTQRREAEGAAEVHDEPRGGTLRRSVGYLLTCPYCLGVWTSTGLATALLVRPNQTRFFLGMLAADTVSDFLHLGFARLNELRRRVTAERRLTEEIAADRWLPEQSTSERFSAEDEASAAAAW